VLRRRQRYLAARFHEVVGLSGTVVSVTGEAVRLPCCAQCLRNSLTAADTSETGVAQVGQPAKMKTPHKQRLCGVIVRAGSYSRLS
jgi:hypothetical protein